LWKGNYWGFLTAKDPDTGQAIIRTVDQREKQNPLKAFPTHLDYVHYLLDVLHNEPKLIIEKASQMFVTTAIMLYFAWKCAFMDGFKVLLSKHKEDEAETILNEKIRIVWASMPEWLRRQIPVSSKPKNRCIFRKRIGIESQVLGLPENAAAADARGQTYQTGLIDEAEWQELLRDLITAMLPRCGQLVIWSTPAKGGDGVSVFRDYLGDDAVTVKAHPDLHALRKKWAIPGTQIRRNDTRGFTVMRIEHTADPAKRPKAWWEKAMREYPSETDARRELKIDRSSNVGRPFYPQFIENPKRFIVRAREIPVGVPIIRGWDFGGDRPACVWSAWSSRSKRFWVLRELLGFSIDTYQFRDLVKYLSGQMSLEALNTDANRDAMKMLESLLYEKAYPKTPWFEGPNRFLDFSGHEGLMGPRGLVPFAHKKTAVEILALGDIHLYAQFTRHSARTDTINGLSRIRDCDDPNHKGCDGHPGFFLDPACPLLIRGLSSGIVYAKATAQNPDPNEPAKDAVYSHLHDALGYAVTNTVSLEDANYFQASMGVDGKPLPEVVEETRIESYLSEGLMAS
jgi:hypothetical protein